MFPDVRSTQGPAVVRVLKVPERSIRKNGKGAPVDVDAFVDRACRVEIRSTAHVGPRASAKRGGFERQVHAGNGTPVVHIHLDPVIETTFGSTDDDGRGFPDGGKHRGIRQRGRRGEGPRHGRHEQDKEDRNKASVRGHDAPPSSSPLNASEHVHRRAEPLDWGG